MIEMGFLGSTSGKKKPNKQTKKTCLSMQGM